MTVRLATRDDLERLQPLYEKESERLFGLCPEHYLKSVQDEELFYAIVEHKSADILIAEGDGEIAASLLLWQTETPLYPFRKSRRFTYVTDFLTDAAERGEALSELLAYAKEWSRAHGSEYIEADIPSADTELLAELSRQGFVPLMNALTLDVGAVGDRESRFENLSRAFGSDGNNGGSKYFSQSVIDEELECG